MLYAYRIWFYYFLLYNTGKQLFCKKVSNIKPNRLKKKKKIKAYHMTIAEQCWNKKWNKWPRVNDLQNYHMTMSQLVFIE